MEEIWDGMNWRDEITVDLHEYFQSFLYLLILWNKDPTIIYQNQKSNFILKIKFFILFYF